MALFARITKHGGHRGRTGRGFSDHPYVCSLRKGIHFIVDDLLKNMGVPHTPQGRKRSRKMVRNSYPLTPQPVHTGTIVLSGKSKSIRRKVRRSK
jgi:hypothetical protein